MNPLTRRKNEPNKSNQRLRYKVEHHITTNTDLVEALQDDPKTKNLSVKYSTIENESAKWNWKERENEYYKQKEQELHDAIENLFQDLNKRGIHDMDGFLTELNDVKKDVLRRFKNKEISSSYVLRTFKDYISCYREATEIYYINSRHKLEPEIEHEPTTTVNEQNIDNELLNNDNMNDRLAMLNNILEGK